MAGASVTYPKRPAFFSHKYIRILWKACVATELGPDVAYLLSGIVMTEDARGYRSAVTFFNEQLCSMAGFANVKAMDRARKKAIDSGWLNYQPGGKGIPGKYFVNIPEEHQDWDDAPSDEGFTTPLTTSKTTKEPGDNRETNGRQVGKEPGENRETSGQHSSLYLDLNQEEESPPPPKGGKRSKKPVDVWTPDKTPLPHTDSAFVEAWNDFVEHRQAKRAPLTNKAAQIIFKTFRKKSLTLSQATECLNDSVANGWTGIFPDKVKNGTGKQFLNSAAQDRDYAAKMAQNIFDRIPPEKLAEIAREEAEEKARQEARKLPTYRQTTQALSAAKPRKDPPPGFQYPSNWDTMQNYEQDMWLIDNGFSPVQRVKEYA